MDTEVPVVMGVFGMKVGVAPVGAPVTANVIGSANPFVRVIPMVNAPVAPCDKLMLSLVTESANDGVVTTRVNEIVWVSEPLVPVTVMVLVDAGAVDVVVSVRLREFPVPLPSVAVTPDGAPLTERDTALANPPVGVIVTVLVVL